MNNLFQAGRNIAMKVPPHEYDATVSFYRDIICLKQITTDKGSGENQDSDSVQFEFGDKSLWIDKVATCSQAEIWLEIVTADTEKAAKLLEQKMIVRCDDIEPLPNGFKGFWIQSPSNIVHLIAGKDE